VAVSIRHHDVGAMLRAVGSDDTDGFIVFHDDFSDRALVVYSASERFITLFNCL
jgi:hypothetical protein